MTTVRTARAWVYKEQLREILERKQIHVARAALRQWCTCVMRSKTRFKTIKTVIFLIAGKLNFHAANPHVPKPT